MKYFTLIFKNAGFSQFMAG